MVDARIKDEIIHVQDLILSEVNVKQLEFIEEIEKSIKPNFRVLGKKVGSKMKAVGDAILAMNSVQIATLEQNGAITVMVDGVEMNLELTDVEIMSKDIPGYKVAHEGKITVALDVDITPDLKTEGIARELVSKLQTLRKDSNLEVTDKIIVNINPHEYIMGAINAYKTYICSEILADQLEIIDLTGNSTEIEVDEHLLKVQLTKAN